MPSAAILKQKQEIVAGLSEKVKDSVAGVLVNYSGITVDTDTAMRAEMRKAGIEYKVYKNSIIERVCDTVGYADMKQYLAGMSALAISKEDPIAAAKILKNYSEKVETLEIKAGYIDGEVIDAAGVMELANIPSREGLIAKMLGSLQSSLYGLAYALQAIIDKSGEEVPASEEAEPAAEEAAPAEQPEEKPAE